MTHKKLILVVCRGNIARSPVAEQVIRNELKSRDMQNQYDVISRGIQGTVLDEKGPPKFHNFTYYASRFAESKDWLFKHGIDLSIHKATPVELVDLKNASIVLAMDKRTMAALRQLFPDFSDKIHMFTEIIGKRKEIYDTSRESGKDRQIEVFTEILDTIRVGFSNIITLAAK